MNEKESFPGPLAPSGCYRIIWDESQVRRFYQLHLAQFQESEYLSFLFFLVCRRKYFPSLTTTDTHFPRRTFSSHKNENLFVQEIRNYEVAEGLYKDKRNNAVIPASGLALYMTCDPLKEMDAWFKTQTEFNQRQQIMINHALLKGENKTEKNENKKSENPPMNVESIFKNKLHASPTKIFKKLDVDTKDPVLIAKLRAMMKENQIKPSLVIESCNGFHVALNQTNGDLPGSSQKILYDFGQAHKEWMTIERNAMLIIPGTFQGGFPTRIVDWLSP